MSKEAMKLALEALENSIGLVEEDYANAVNLYGKYPSRAQRLIGMETMRDDHRKAITALREALAEQPAQQDSTCSNALRIQHKAYPRTCKKCGLGPCVELAQQALDKMAENARELGLDYEPAQQEPVAWISKSKNLLSWDMFYDDMTPLYTSPQAQRTWVGLTDEEVKECFESVPTQDCQNYEHWRSLCARNIETKLREKNT